MFAYISGIIDYVGLDYIVIDVSGVGYKIFVPPASIEKIGNNGDNVKVYTHHYVREDNIALYGFKTREELRIFELLLIVSGIGGKVALNILSGITPYDFSIAVISGDVKALTKISGVGPKVAQRIILELKDRLKTEYAIQGTINDKVDIEIIENNNVGEAISALQVLGYSVKDIKNVIEKLQNVNTLDTQGIIKKVLLNLSK